ncbi:ion channel [Marinobacterium halophilum]|uniref:Ion channel n=1 Tax=Marinobacterium halophilum TaxID=267374 RepID=A0A2P8ET61_9GAMM|nr:ion channel [Marinobacterium halophilum]PSL12661.1 ion channel [Marinobacterium halophilum]
MQNWLPVFRKYSDLIALAFTFFLVIAVLKTLKFWGDPGLWIIFGTLVCSALISSYRFFNTPHKFESFAHFLIVVILMIFMFAFLYRVVGLCCDAEGNTFDPDWLNAIYFSVVTWTTLGYGGFSPPENLKLFAMAEALMGQVFMAMIVGKTIFLLQRNDKGENLKDS